MKAALKRLGISMLLVALALAGSPAVSSGAASAETYVYSTRWPLPTWHLKKPTDMALDSAGNVYVIEQTANQVQKFDTSGAFVSKWGAEGTGDGSFKAPTGIAVGGNGHVYVADTGNHRIQEFDSSGHFVRKWGKSGGPDFWGSGPGEFNNPTGVAVDGTGNVYVADKSNARIQKFTSSGGFIKQWGSPGSNDDQFLEPRNVTVDSAGNVYVVDANQTNSRVQKFDTEGRFIRKWGAWDKWYQGHGLFRYPSGVAVDSNGDVYVSEQGDVAACRVQKFDADGAWLTEWGGPSGGVGSGDGQFRKPYGITVDALDHVWVADTDNDRVQQFSTVGTVLGVDGSYGTSPGRFKSPAAVAVAPSGDVYVADRDNHRVQHFTSTGGLAGYWGSPYCLYGSDNGLFWQPSGIAVDASGSVYVADTKNNRIQKFDALGAYDTKWGTLGTGDGWFNGPQGVAAKGPYIYVADTENNRIQKFDREGDYLGKWGTAGAANGQLSKPAGVAVDAAGNVYVADTGNHRVQKFSSSGAFLAKWGSLGTSDGRFSSPVGISVDSAGNVLVADTNNNRLQKFTASGTFVLSWGTAGTQPGEFSHPSGVAAAANGHVYVADRDNHRIQSFLLATPIRIVIAGVAEGGQYASVTPNVTFEGPVANSSVLINGQPWLPQTVYSDEGPYTLAAWAEDEAGNETSATIHFVVDGTAPHTTSDAAATYDEAATIHLSGTDGVSGVADTRYSLDGAPAVSGTTVSTQRWGDHMLTYWSTDGAGNVETPHSASFTVSDTHAPVTGSDAAASYTRVATIRLDPDDACSGVAQTYWSLDGGPLATGRTISTSAVGAHALQYRSVDFAGNSEATRSVLFTVVPGDVQSEPVQGTTRFETAVAASARTFPNGADDVVITTAWNWPDALGGSALAGVLDGPILLVNRDSIPKCVYEELERLDAKRVTILGSESAVSGAVESALKGLLGQSNVARIGGSDRYDTAKLISAEVVDGQAAYDGVAFVATGLNYPDALAASPLASAKHWPIYLTPAAAIPQATLDAMHAAGVTDVLILGGDAAVSDGVRSALERSFGATRVRRLEGANRYATAVTVATYGVQNAGLAWDRLALATGESFPDGLAGGILQGKSGSVLLLTPQSWLHPAPEAVLKANAASIGTVRYLGSEAAVGQPVRDSVTRVLRY